MPSVAKGSVHNGGLVIFSLTAFNSILPKTKRKHTTEKVSSLGKAALLGEGLKRGVNATNNYLGDSLLSNLKKGKWRLAQLLPYSSNYYDLCHNEKLTINQGSLQVKWIYELYCSGRDPYTDNS